jgi:cystathionine beta-lyase/cystathionine gamma-synthase
MKDIIMTSRYGERNLDKCQIETQIVHCGSEPDPLTGAMTAPIYQTATYALEEVGVTKGYNYSRSINPTVCALEKKLVSIENALGSIATRSGLAATTVLTMALLKHGDHIICTDVIFGGTIRLFSQVFSKFGISISYVDTTDINKVTEAIQDNTRMIFVETPANPLLKITDLRALAEISRLKAIPLVVDNTFLTAVGQRPLDLGASIVLYSTTKYIDGHNSTVGGALLTNNSEYLSTFNFIRNAIGCIQAPHDAWLTMQGLKTLHIRMERHCENALTIAKYLEKHPLVSHVIYPGLPSFNQHDLAKSQQLCFGGMLAFEVTGGYKHALHVMNSLKLCALAESLGATESLVTHPASMTHKMLSEEERVKIGIGNGLIRLSVGLENPQDIINDLDLALKFME